MSKKPDSKPQKVLEEAKKKQAEEEAKRKAEEEAKKKENDPEEMKRREEEEKLKREEEERKRIEEEERQRKRQEQAVTFEKYLEDSGLPLAFQIIMAEVIAKKIPEEQIFPYTAMRLRQIGQELDQVEK